MGTLTETNVQIPALPLVVKGIWLVFPAKAGKVVALCPEW